MAETTEFLTKLTEALNLRKDWLEKEEIPKLKDDVRTFHNAFTSIYSLMLRRKLVLEDPYKQETKVTELKVPEASTFNENERVEILTLRLSEFDNQLDFLSNFYSFSLEYLPLDKIRLIHGLVRYIDWTRVSTDAASTSVTRGVAETINLLRIGADAITASVVTESLNTLQKTSVSILNYLKSLTTYNREAFKFDLRTQVIPELPPGEATQVAQIKKKFASVNPRKPFYPDLVEELIRENHPTDGPALQLQALKNLEIPKAKPKVVKQPVSYTTYLIEGLLALSGVSASLAEIAPKLDENAMILANKSKGFLDKIRRLWQQMMNKELESPEYEVAYTDSAKGTTVKETVVFASFRADLDKKTKSFANYNSRAVPKMEALQEAQLNSLLERSLRDIQELHKTLTALDTYFKAAVDKEDREKIKGIKPELAAIKNAIVKANQKRYEYSAQKEEEEQFKKLGISNTSS